MRPTKAAPSKVEQIRLAPSGTRVVVLKASSSQPGFISDIRRESHLKTYVIVCDDGSTVYASAHEIAREDDGSRTPLAPAPEY